MYMMDVYCILAYGNDPVPPNWRGSHLSWIINTDRAGIHQKTRAGKTLQIAQRSDKNMDVITMVGGQTASHITPRASFTNMGLINP